MGLEHLPRKRCTYYKHIGTETIPAVDFVLQKGIPSGICKSCHRIRRAKKRAETPMNETLWMSAKYSSKGRGLDFTLLLEDVIIPERCPILGILMVQNPADIQNGNGRGNLNNFPNYPTIDRLDSSKGYHKNNILVISWRANSLKKDATKEEVEKLYHWFKGIDI